jgi:multidrug efflux system membrane fusion protein
MPPKESLELAPPVEGDFTARKSRPETPPAAHAPPAPHARPYDTPPKPKRKGSFVKRLVWVLILAAVVAGAWWRIGVVRQAAENKPGAGGRGGGGGNMPVPVVSGIVKASEVPIYLDGLGTIQALNTVTVRARVEGEIQKVAFEEGKEVNKGDLLVQIDPAPFKAAVDQAQAKLEQDQVQLANAERDTERNQELVQRKVIAAQQFDTQKATTEALRRQVKNDEAALTSAKVQLEYTRITSPIKGRTGIRMVDSGNMVRTNDANGLVVITQLQPISLIFTLPEQNLPEIQKQQLAAKQAADKQGLKVLAIGRDNKTVLGEGRLAVIDNQIDTATGTIRLKAEFPNEDRQLWPGQFANVRLLLEIRKNGLTVPAQTVQRGPDNAYVYVIKPDQTAEMRTVKVAQIDEGLALIDSGLKAGEKVVVDGHYRLQAGGKVIEPGAGGGPGGPRGGAGKGGGQGKKQ